MTIITTMKVSLKDFEFWNNARDTRSVLTDSQLETIENTLSELYPEGLDEIELNDIFWFEDNWLAEILGYSDFEELRKHNEEEEDDCEEITDEEFNHLMGYDRGE